MCNRLRNTMQCRAHFESSHSGMVCGFDNEYCYNSASTHPLLLHGCNSLTSTNQGEQNEGFSECQDMHDEHQ